MRAAVRGGHRRAVMAVVIMVGLGLSLAPGASAAGGGASVGGLPVTVLDSRHLQLTLSDGRDYVLQLPALHVSAWPLVIGLPGWRNTWHDLAHDAGLDAHADANNYIVAYGIGIDESWDGGGCCGTAGAEHIDDVGYLVAIVEDIERRFLGLVDPSRVYLMGFSAGHMLAYRAECEHPEFFAGIGGAGGTMFGSCVSSAARPIRAVHVHGGHDTAVPWRGGYSRYLHMFVPAGQTIAGRIRGGSQFIAVLAPKCGHVWPSVERCGFDATDTIWRYLEGWRR